MRVHVEIERKFGLLAFAPAALAIACVDTTPVSIEIAELDAGVDGEGACVACVEAPNAPGPGCADELAVCFQYEECEGTNVCAKEAQCYELPSVPDLVSCSVGCGEEVGLGTNLDALDAAEAFFSCMLGSCDHVCGVPEVPSGD